MPVPVCAQPSTSPAHHHPGMRVPGSVWGGCSRTAETDAEQLLRQAEIGEGGTLRGFLLRRCLRLRGGGRLGGFRLVRPGGSAAAARLPPWPPRLPSRPTRLPPWSHRRRPSRPARFPPWPARRPSRSPGGFRRGRRGSVPAGAASAAAGPAAGAATAGASTRGAAFIAAPSFASKAKPGCTGASAASAAAFILSFNSVCSKALPSGPPAG